MEAEDNSSSSERRALVNWFMHKFDENKGNKLFVVVLVYYIRNIISARFAGIVFDKYFKLASSNICEKERKTMEGISRLHSAHNETLSKIPVYIAPDHHVLLERLTLMDQLCQTAKQNTIITRSVLAKLDKLKKDSANAREAIRWIQGSVTDHKIKLFHEVESEKNLFSELKAFLEEKNLLDKQTLFLSILTIIGIERIENFAKRMAETDIPKS
uniref:PIN domain-containing protein n=1 Tax=Meloidogyne javanica TaxID=6303 RepID=A0A915M0S3_MELJA